VRTGKVDKAMAELDVAYNETVIKETEGFWAQMDKNRKAREL